MPDQPERTAPPAAPLPPSRSGYDLPVQAACAGPWRRAMRIATTAAVVFYFLIVAAILTLRYAVLPELDRFRPQMEAMASRAVSAHVTLGSVRGHWRGLSPGMEITNLRIDDAAGHTALRVPHVVLALSWRSLAHWQPVFTALQIDAPDVVATRSADGRVTVGGIALGQRKGRPFAFNTWLLSQGALVVRNGTLHWHDALRGQADVTASAVSAAVFNYGRLHRLALRVGVADGLASGPIDLRARFTHALLGTPGDPGNWQGELYADAQGASLPALASRVALPVDVRAGRLDARTWTGFAQGHLTRSEGRLEAATLGVQVSAERPPLNLPFFVTDYHAQRDGDQFSVRFTDLKFDLREGPLAVQSPALIRQFRAGRFDGRYRPSSARAGESLGMAGDLIDLDLLAQLSRSLPLPPNATALVKRFNPRGILRDYTVAWERAAPSGGAGAHPATPPRLLSYRVAGDLSNVGIAAQEPRPGVNAAGHPYVGLPGFTHVSGHIDADEKAGALTLDTRDATVTVKGLFDLPTVQLDALSAAARWRVEPADSDVATHPAVEANVDRLSFANADAAGSLTAHYRNPGSGRGDLDLAAHVERAVVAQVPRYLPTSVGPKLRQYLGHALQAGSSAGGTVELSGALDRFPFRDPGDKGVFHIVAPFTGARVDISPTPAAAAVAGHRNGGADGAGSTGGASNTWPPFDALSGKFELDRDRIAFDVDRGRYSDVTLSHITGRIDSLHDRGVPLVVSGNADGPLRDMLDYVAHSPLANRLGTTLERVTAQGPAALRLRVEMPRIEHPHPNVSGTLDFAGNRLTYASLPPLTDVAGRVEFTNKSGSSRGITGQFLGGVFRGSGHVSPAGAYAFKVDGRIAADATRDATSGADSLARALGGHFSGSAPYAATVSGAKRTLPEVTVSSDLTGLGIDLPDPVKKAPGTPMPLSLVVKPAPDGENGLSEARASVGPLDAHFLWRGGIHPEAVRGALGVNRKVDLPARGVVAAIDLKRVDADVWRKLAQQLRDAATGPGSAATARPAAATALLPDHVTANIGALTLFNRRWDDVDVNATGTEGAWRAELASKQVTGNATWRPPGAGSVHGALRVRAPRVAIPASLPGRTALAPLLPKTPASLPALDLQVDDLNVQGRDIGRVELVARNRTIDGAPVWQLERLAMNNPLARLTASGKWGGADGQPADGPAQERHSTFDFTADMTDAGALLDRLGMPRTIQGGNGKFTGHVGWHGSPNIIDKASLHGVLALNLAHGQILRVDPGIAKLLGVLSLQSLTRFLVLDFKSVTEKGLPFDRVSGTGTIDRGVATTRDFRIDSPIARIDMEGSADIARETQNLQVSVAPKINAASAALAAAVVNPLLGLGTYVAQLVLSESISHSFALHYAVSGPWSHPHVERIAGVRGNMGKSAVLSTDGAPQPAEAP